jgi:hypothetical protein
MCQVTNAASKYPEITRLLKERPLSFPIDSKNDFVAQMVASGEQIVFRGVSYDTQFGAALLPAFFFPLQSADDLITKIVELFVSRGLMPPEASPMNANQEKDFQ